MRAFRYPTEAPPSDGFFAGMTEWNDWDAAKAIDEGLKSCYALYAGSTQLADWVSQPPWMVRKKTKDGIEDQPDHPLMDVVREPGFGTEWDAGQGAIVIDRIYAGDSYQLIIQSGASTFLRRLQPNKMSAKKKSNGRLDHWVYQKGGPGEREYEPEAVIHHTNFNPSNEIFGLSNIQAASRIVDSMNAGLTANKSAMGNRIWSSGMFTPELHGQVVGLDDKQHKALIASVKKFFSGPKNAKSMFISPYPGKYSPFNLTPVEMDFIKSFGHWEDALWLILHLHADAMGKSGSTFENKEWAIAAAWNGPVSSYLRSSRSNYNGAFAALFGTSWPPKVGDVYLDFDLTGTPGVLSAFKDKIEMLKALTESGLPFDDANARLELGLPSFAGSNQSWRPINMIPSSQVIEPSGDDDRSGRRSTRLSDDEIYLRTIASKKAAWDRKARSLIKEIFGAEGEEIAAAVEKGNLDPKIDTKRWSKTLDAIWRNVVEAMGDEVINDLNGDRALRVETRDIAWDPFKPAVISYIKRQVAKHVDLIKGTTAEGLRRVIEEGREADEDYGQIAKRIREQYAQYERTRSIAIAWTEVHSASGYGMDQAAQQSGVVETATWITSGDENVRNSHESMNGETRKLGQKYSNGLKFVGDPDGDPDEVIRCRCAEKFGLKG